MSDRRDEAVRHGPWEILPHGQGDAWSVTIWRVEDAGPGETLGPFEVQGGPWSTREAAIAAARAWCDEEEQG
jgi:hypothetical protein